MEKTTYKSGPRANGKKKNIGSVQNGISSSVYLTFGDRKERSTFKLSDDWLSRVEGLFRPEDDAATGEGTENKELIELLRRSFMGLGDSVFLLPTSLETLE